MKKCILLFFLVAIFAISVEAQNTTFVEGDKVLNLGLGIGSTQYSGSFYSNNIPPLSASFEVGVVDELFDENSTLGIGGYLGYSGSNYSGFGGEFNFSNIVFGARGTVHYQFVELLDTYAGLMLGYRIVNWESSSGGFNFGSAASSGFASAFFIGGRYYFSEQLAALLELGYGVAYLNVGVAIKF